MFWPQERQLCQVHSLNHYYNRTITTGNALLQWCAHQNSTIRRFAYTPNSGNFSTTAMEVWMIENGWQANSPANQEAPYQIHNPPSQPIEPGSSKEQITSILPPGAQAAIVHTIDGRGGITYGHAYCIRQHPPNSNNWILLDSELNTGPTSLDNPPTERMNIYGEGHHQGATFSTAAHERRAPKWGDIHGHI